MTGGAALPIVILSFDRTDYLRRTLDSLLKQADANVLNRQIYLFQDGAVNDFSGKQHCSPAAVTANVELFQALVPHGTPMAAPANLGVARNFNRAERFVFEELGADAAIFLEDDLVLGRYYIKTLETMIGLALSDPRIGYVAAYGNHRASAEEQFRRRSELTLMGHNWAFGLTRRQWLLQKPYVDQYLEIVGTSDYRGRDHGRIGELFRSWGLGVPGTSQDIAKSHAAILTEAAKVNTFSCFGRYIGETGLHFNPDTFRKLGFGDTAIIDGDVFKLVPPTDAQIASFIKMARHSAMQDNPGIPRLSQVELDNRPTLAKSLLSDVQAMRDAKKFDEAEARCGEGMAKFSDYKDQYGHPAFLKEALRIVLMRGQLARAIRLGEELGRRVRPNDPCVQILFGRHFHRAGDLAGARQNAREVLQRDPQNAEALNWLQPAL